MLLHSIELRRSVNSFLGTEMGQGLHTKMIQVAAHTLHIREGFKNSSLIDKWKNPLSGWGVTAGPLRKSVKKIHVKSGWGRGVLVDFCY